MSDFKFYNPVRIIYGRGKAEEIASICKGNNIFIITGPVTSQMPFFEKLKQTLGNRYVGAFNKVQPNPECDTAEEVVELVKSCGADYIIGVGGGSSMDTAKIVAAAVAEGRNVIEYFSGRCQPCRRLPLLLMPTTSGSGSEVTNVSVMSGKLEGMGMRVKKPIVSDYLYPDIAVVDPALTDTMPPRLTAITGFDAYCHAIEAYWATSSNPLSDTYALHAIKLIIKNLAIAYQNPDDQTARDNMSLASLMAGVAFSQTRTTVLHANSYYLTEKYKIEHGAACAILLVPFIKKNMEAVSEKLNLLAQWCGFKDAYQLADATEVLYNACGMPTKLSSYGVNADDLEVIAEEALKQPITSLNPVKVTKEMLIDMMFKVL